eukprot:IDg9120t1
MIQIIWPSRVPRHVQQCAVHVSLKGRGGKIPSRYSELLVDCTDNQPLRSRLLQTLRKLYYNFIDKDYSPMQAPIEHGIAKQTVTRRPRARATLIAMHKKGVHRDMQRPLKGQYTEIELAVPEFVDFLRSQR